MEWIKNKVVEGNIIIIRWNVDMVEKVMSERKSKKKIELIRDRWGIGEWWEVGWEEEKMLSFMFVVKDFIRREWRKIRKEEMIKNERGRKIVRKEFMKNIRKEMVENGGCKKELEIFYIR